MVKFFKGMTSLPIYDAKHNMPFITKELYSPYIKLSNLLGAIAFRSLIEARRFLSLFTVKERDLFSVNL